MSGSGEREREYPFSILLSGLVRHLHHGAGADPNPAFHPDADVRPRRSRHHVSEVVAMRVTGSSSFLLMLVVVVAAGCSSSSPGIMLQANPGASPGIVMDSFPPGTSNSTATTAITVSSVGGFSGGVFLDVTCCEDVMRGRTAPLAPGLVWSWQGVAGHFLMIPEDGSSTATLHLTLTGSLVDRPMVPYGKYLMTVTGTAQGASHTDETTVAITVMPEIIGRSSSCVSSPPNPSGQPPVYYADSTIFFALNGLIAAAAQSQPPSMISIATYQNPQSLGRAVRLDITTAVDYAEDSARVGISNLTSGVTTKGVSTGCVPVSQRRETHAPPMGGSSFTIRKGTDRTVIVRERVCAGLFCSSPIWIDLIHLPDEGFWDAFGGKTLIFTFFPP